MRNSICDNCVRYNGPNNSCTMTTIPLDNLDECEYYEDNITPIIDNDYYGMPEIDETNPSQIVITQQIGDTVYTAKINVRSEWDYDDIENAKQQALKNILKRHNEKISNKTPDNINSVTYDTSDPSKIIVRKLINGVTYKAEVDVDPRWDISDIEYAKAKALEELDRQYKDIPIPQTSSVQKQQEQQLGELLKTLNTTLEDLSVSNEDGDKTAIKINNETSNEKDKLTQIMEHAEKMQSSIQNYLNGKSSISSGQEEMLNGDTKLSWFNAVTSWKRVLNAARRTIGKAPIQKEPTDSWKAKILLAEHSPIRLLEYDWGWEKIRQWVTAHLVRHHEGVEKFVHSQRADRRELPCDRDHIFQGAKNDMDMTANAQGLINMSRKRCCNCASKETRDAWNMVLNKLETVDPVLRDKCVPECIYRGFCPEWMSTCKFVYSDAYWKKLAEYRNTKYGKDIIYKYNHELEYIVSNTGKIYQASGYNENIDPEQIPYTCYEITPKKEITNTGERICVGSEKMPLDMIVYCTFTEQHIDILKKIKHKDGNIWNNAIENLEVEQ